jgi:hypothetical protein
LAFIGAARHSRSFLNRDDRLQVLFPKFAQLTAHCSTLLAPFERERVDLRSSATGFAASLSHDCALSAALPHSSFVLAAIADRLAVAHPCPLPQASA